MSIDILSHFEEATNANGITIFQLKDDERDDFFSKLPAPFRMQYISDDDLEWRINNDPESVRSAEISEKIPSTPHLKSGEFGELFLFFLIPERYTTNPILLPPKWKWKEGKNHPPHYTDVVIFNQNDETNPSAEDFLISIESKAKATGIGANNSSLKDAIEDAKKDYISRLSESLFQISTKYKDDRNAEALQLLDRFLKPSKYPTYEKRFIAAAVVDNAFGDRHIANVGVIPTDIKDTFQVILVRISDLRGGYETTYNEMPNT